MDHPTPNAFLASVIACPRGARIAGDALFRRYSAVVRTNSKIGGNVDSRATRILYEIGRRNATSKEDLARPPADVIRSDAAYPTATAIAEDFTGLARKYTNFSASFAYSALGGIVERLASAVASFSIHGELTSTDLRAGQPLNVHSLGTYDGPVNSLNNTVFIPRLVNTVMSGDVFAVIANAACGEGASVATDVLELDVVTRRPILSHVEGYGLMLACVNAMRIIGANMNASNQGPLFALALTRGLHKVLTVVSHTDEGGIHRDLLRCGGFGVPFGGIHFGLHEYAGLPALSTNGGTEIAAFCDSLLLTSAALVAHSDPGIRFEGEWYPTFFLGTDATSAYSQPGNNTPGTAAMANRHRSQLVNDYGRFLENYVPALGRLFAIEGDASIAIRFQAAMAHNLAEDNRHLRFASVAPHFWIEPTSLIPQNFLGSEAEQQGFASIAGKNCSRNMPAWESISPAGLGNPLFSSYVIKMRSARTSGFLLHWLGHPMDGLGALIPKQLDPTQVIHPGSGGGNQTVAQRVIAGADITSFLWVRGQSPFPAPGELINLNPYYGIMARHGTMDDEGFPTEEHLPNHSEFEHTQIDIAVGIPTGLPTAAANAWDSTARRAKTKAARSLATAVNRVRLFGRADVNEMAMSLTAPMPARGTKMRDDNSVMASGGAVSEMSVHAAPIPLPTEADPNAVARTVTGLHGPTTVPPLVRPGQNQPGGGQPRLPPPADDVQQPLAVNAAPDTLIEPVQPAPAPPAAAPANGPNAQ